MRQDSDYARIVALQGLLPPTKKKTLEFVTGIDAGIASCASEHLKDYKVGVVALADGIQGSRTQNAVRSEEAIIEEDAPKHDQVVPQRVEGDTAEQAQINLQTIFFDIPYGISPGALHVHRTSIFNGNREDPAHGGMRYRGP